MSQSTSEPILSCAREAAEERGFSGTNNVEPTKKTILPAVLETRIVVMWECGSPSKRTKCSQDILLVNCFIHLKILFMKMSSRVI